MTFEDIVAGLEDELDEYIPEDLTVLSVVQLMDRLHAARKDLLDRGVALDPKTPEDIEKQSLYYGLVQEMRRRRLM